MQKTGVSLTSGVAQLAVGALVLVVVMLAIGFAFRAERAPSASIPGAGENRPIVAVNDATPAAAANSDDPLCLDYQEAAADSGREAASDLELAESRRKLLVSQSPEILASVALMAVDDAPTRLDAINRAMTTGRQNATVVWSAVLICDRPPGDLECPAQVWEDELLKLDSGNSEAWIRAAASSYERGDGKQALDALRRASTAAETRDYWPETVAMLERALESAGGYSFPQRVTLAFGLAAANQPAFPFYVNMCSKQSKLDAEWAQTCLDYGRLVERQAKTDIGIEIGQSIQFAALEAMGDTGGAEAVQARKADAAQSRETDASGARTDAYIFSNPRLFADYLAAVREHGERAALARLRPVADDLASQCSPQRVN